MDIVFWVMVLFTVGAVVLGYVAYAKVRAGQQPGEAWIDAFLAKIRGNPKTVTQADIDAAVANAIAAGIAAKPLTPAEVSAALAAPSTVRRTQADIDRAVAAALARQGQDWREVAEQRAAEQRIAAGLGLTPALPTQPAPAPAPTGVRAMHPQSNAYLLDPALGLSDTSPEGYGLYYQVEPYTAAGGKPKDGTLPTLNYGGVSSHKDAAAIDAWIARVKQRDAASDQFAAQWSAERFNGPIAASPLPAAGDLGYAAGRVGDYHAATGGRDLFRDLFAGSNPEIAHARNIANANVNQGLPFDPQLPAIVETLIARHRK